jgi:hypothetical protein
MALTKQEAKAIILYLPGRSPNPGGPFNGALESLHEKAKEALGGRWIHKIKLPDQKGVK